ncbi:MAG TPA: TolC family protein [Anaeromyxobacter sp.]|nr:TolC family protein [Anaeromyxobacter sp.]
MIRLALTLALAAGPGAPLAAAPDAEAQGPVLTLEGALAEARSRSIELRLAAERLAQAETLSRKAWSYYLPQLSLGASYAWNSDDVVLDLPTSFAIRQLVGPNGQPINYPNLPPQDPTKPVSPSNPPGLPTSYLLYPLSYEELELQRKEQYGLQAEVQQALFAPQVLRAVQSAGLARELAQARVAATRQDVLFAVAQLYYGAASLREVVAVQERTLETWRRHEADAAQLVAQGVAPRLALLKARTDRARAEQDVIRARNGYDAARQALATLLDREADFEVVRPPEPSSPGEDLEDAASRRPDVRAAEAGVRLAEGSEREITARYLPTVGLKGEWHYASITGFTGKHDGWSVTLGARWALFDGGRREADRSEAEHRALEAAAALDLARNRARDEVRRAELDLRSAAAAQRKAEEQSHLAQEALQHAQAAYAQGAATYLEVADATAATENAELARVSEELNAQLARLRLSRAAGEFER